MRLFLAVDLPDKTKKSIAEQLEAFKKEYPYFRWVDPSRYHITLHFFGNKRDPEKLKDQIEEAVYDVEPFRMYSGETDLFMKNTIILHLEFQRNRMLEKLVSQVREKFQTGNSMKFMAHLTIARYRIPSKQQYLLIKKKVQRLDIDVDFLVSQITLYNSVIEGEKPLYETIAKIALQKS